MRNVEWKIEGSKLIITINLHEKGFPSKSGKSIIIASTEGNKEVQSNVFLGLNLYKKVNISEP